MSETLELWQTEWCPQSHQATLKQKLGVERSRT
jgi:hypothetical protein